MKKTIFIVIALIGFLTIGKEAFAQTIRISGTRFTYPLFQKWIDEYMKENPSIHFILNSKQPSDSVDIAIVSHILAPKDIKLSKTELVVSRYLQLPVVNSNRPDIAELQEKGFDNAQFKKVYFGDNVNTSLASDAIFTAYKRKQPACASQSFANHFNSQQNDIKGIGVVGDDKDLLTAVKQDKNGISYNNLGFIYDINTRKLVDSIAIIPIDFNENGKIDDDEKIYGSLDNVIVYAEKTNSPKLWIENVHVLFNKGNPKKEVASFLQWVLSKGQQYNHAFGFLKL